MIWLIVAILTGIAFLQTIRWTQHAKGSVAFAGWVNYQLAGAFFVIPFIFYLPPNLNWPVFGLGLATGALYVGNFFLLAAMFRRIGLALASATMTLAVVVPVFVSIAFGDPWLDKTAGLVVALIALPMVAMARADLRGRGPATTGARRVAWVALLFVAVGAENTFLKVAQELGGKGFERFFLPPLFGAAAVLATPVILLVKPKIASGDMMRGLILGACNIVAGYAIALSVQAISGPVVFPVRLIGMLVGTAALGRLLWQERLSRLGLVGIALCLVATVLLGLGRE